MKIWQRPVPATLLFGLVCGMSFIPLNLVLSTMFYWPPAICLTLWLFSAGYAALLCRWSRQKMIPVSYPLLFLLMTAFWVQSINAFFFLALAAISWVRSGLCYGVRRGMRLVTELIICLAGGAGVAVFTPGSALAWSLGIWLFFLLQALYFAVFDSGAVQLSRPTGQAVDPFERASRRAEEILSAPPA